MRAKRVKQKCLSPLRFGSVIPPAENMPVAAMLRGWPHSVHERNSWFEWQISDQEREIMIDGTMILTIY